MKHGLGFFCHQEDLQQAMHQIAFDMQLGAKAQSNMNKQRFLGFPEDAKLWKVSHFLRILRLHQRPSENLLRFSCLDQRPALCISKRTASDCHIELQSKQDFFQKMQKHTEHYSYILYPIVCTYCIHVVLMRVFEVDEVVALCRPC